MRKVSKDILERAIKTGMKSEGYSGKTLDRRAVSALRGDPQFKKLLSKKSVDQKQVYAALEALKKKGLISERVDEKFLVKNSVAENRVHWGGEMPEVKSTGWTRPEENPPEPKAEDAPPPAPKDLPI